MNDKTDKIIWIFHHYATPPTMTGLTRPYDFAKNLISEKYKCIIFSSSFLHYSGENIIKNNSCHCEINENNVPFVFVKTNPYKNSKLLRAKNMLDYYLNLIRITKTYANLYGKPDVIIGSSAHPLAAIAAIRLAKRYGCQSIVEIRDLWPESFVAYNIIKKNNPILKLLYAGEKWIYKKADKLIFTMEGGRDYIIENGWDKEHGGPIDINKVYHINNGVDLEVFDYNKERYVLEDEDLMDDGTFKVVYAGSIRLVNKVEKILDVAKYLSGQNIKFLIWGDGDQLEPLRKRVKNEQINNVCFKGRVDKKYIPYITSKAQLNIMLGENMPLFRYGGSMNKLFDYFASGKPILSTFKMGYSLINKYSAGIELNNSSTENIADSILSLKNLDKEVYLKYCRNARKAAEDYSFKNLTYFLIHIIEA
jgi:glycosyltransferase involved in cell wall biosynthesis